MRSGSNRLNVIWYRGAVDPQLIAYLSFTAILVITPGATTAVVTRNALMGGRKAGIAAALGAATGNTSHAAAAGFGLAVVFSRSSSAMTALTFAGAAYLAWLGMRSVYRVLNYPDGDFKIMDAERDGIDPERAYRHSFRQGLAVNLLNPAIATFYLIVVPSFVRAGAPRWHFAVFAAVHIVMAFVCHGAWAVAFDELRRLFRPPAARRALEATTGLALIALAIRVLTT
jgi:threonine/homoserine/homoserine lactone efflux protein